MEPKYPGLVERYVNLGDCYDRAGLQPLRQELMGCMKGYKACYQRAYRCLTAAAQIGEDLRSLLLTPALEAKMAKRARGILSREVKKGDGEAGRAVQRFLGGVTWKGVLCQFETVDTLCKRVYELADTYGLAHSMLTHLAAGALAAGHDVIVCPSPLFPDRMEHLLIPSLSLAFVSASPSLPYPKRPYRRIRLDAMADAELLRRNKARLKFSRKVSAALVEEAVDSLAQAKAMHDELEGLYNPHVDFDRVYQTAQAVQVPVIGMGGIMNGEDALEFILAGASAVAIGTANFHNPYATVEAVEGIRSYMERYGIDDIKQLIGAVR